MARTRRLNIKQKRKVVKTKGQAAGSFRLMGRALRHIWAHKRLFAAILAVYAVLYLLMVKGLATGFRLDASRQAIEDAVGQDGSRLGMASALFGALIGTAGNASGEAGGVYQLVLLVMVSLAIIWSLRQTFGKRTSEPGVREAFYQSMYPLVPYLLVGLVIVLQLLPALIGTTIYGVVTAGGIAVNALEQVLWLAFLVIMMGVSAYLLSSSILASYIVTLPGMTPMKALRSARKLVKLRRFMIIRKALFFPFAVFVFMALLFLPLVLYATVLAEITFLIFALLLVLITHAYFYVLYRELL